MKICAAADMHYPRGGPERSARVAAAMNASQADVLVLAGDIASGEGDRYAKVLALFEEFQGPRLFVPGNHDLWSDEHPLDTRVRHDVWLKQVVEVAGFHYLPGQPLVHNGVGFIGTVGWYDYSLKQLESPRPGMRVTPMTARPGDEAMKLSPIHGRFNVHWSDLRDSDYAGKALVWQDDGEQESLIWNDAIYVDWLMTDAEATCKLRDQLAADARSIAPHCDAVVAICHCVPFDELLHAVSEDVSNAYCRAYMGASVLGEAMMQTPHMRLALCGHSHRQRVASRGDVVMANCSVGDGKAGPLLITVPGMEDQ